MPSVLLAGLMCWSRITVRLVLPAVLWCCLVSSDGYSITPQVFLDNVRAKDAQFDNFSLQFYELGQQVIPGFRASDNPRFAKEYELEDDPGAVISFRMRCNVIARGGEVTYSKEVVEQNILSGNPNYGITSNQRWSNASDVALDFRDSGGRKAMTILPNTPGADSGQIYLREIKFAFGIGFGNYITAISDFRQIDSNNCEVTATLAMESGVSGKLVAKYELPSYVVRTAAVSLDSGRKEYKITTMGLAGSKPRLLANGGSLSVSQYRSVIGGERRKDKGNSRSFKVEFSSCDFDLSGSTYDKLTTMPDGADVQLQDPYKLKPELFASHEVERRVLEESKLSGRQSGLPLAITFCVVLVLAALVIRKRIIAAQN